MRLYSILFLAAGLSLAACVLGADPGAATQAGEKHVLKDGLIIEDVFAGDPAAKNGDIVWVQYTGRLEDGTKFDSSYDHPDKAPHNFTLGNKEVILGWDEGIVGMKVGDKRKLTILPALAYGAKGRGAIPPNATLIFDVELVGLARAGK